MKRLGEICSVSYYALEKSDVVIDEYTFYVISKSLESVFNMVPIAAQEQGEAQHSVGVASKCGTANTEREKSLCLTCYNCEIVCGEPGYHVVTRIRNGDKLRSECGKYSATSPVS